MKSVLPKSVLSGKRLQRANLDENEVPVGKGLYEIHIYDPKCLPSPFSDVLLARNQTLIYIGKAEGKQGIRQRLFRQDLNAKGHATFFRSLGLVLGYKDCVKPLKHEYNFQFEDFAKEEIINWIKHNLWIGWKLFKNEKKSMIQKHRPILNIEHNLDRYYLKLARLRDEACAEARDLAKKRFPVSR